MILSAATDTAGLASMTAAGFQMMKAGRSLLTKMHCLPQQILFLTVIEIFQGNETQQPNLTNNIFSQLIFYHRPLPLTKHIGSYTCVPSTGI